MPDVRAPARVLFVTGFDQGALRTLEINDLEYLIKPISPENFASALRQLPSTPATSRPDSANPFFCYDTILVQTDAGPRFIPLAEISAILSNGNYSDVILRCHRKYFTRRTMKAWEELLPPGQFFRVHRQSLVNLTCVEAHRRSGRETLALSVTGVREPVGVSRYGLAALMPHLPVTAA